MAIIHIVHFGFSSSVSSQEKRDIADRFLALKETCTSAKEGKKYIVDVKGGTNNSPEGMAHGLEVSLEGLRMHPMQISIRKA